MTICNEVRAGEVAIEGLSSWTSSNSARERAQVDQAVVG